MLAGSKFLAGNQIAHTTEAFLFSFLRQVLEQDSIEVYGSYLNFIIKYFLHRADVIFML